MILTVLFRRMKKLFLNRVTLKLRFKNRHFICNNPIHFPSINIDAFFLDEIIARFFLVSINWRTSRSVSTSATGARPKLKIHGQKHQRVAIHDPASPWVFNERSRAGTCPTTCRLHLHSKYLYTANYKSAAPFLSGTSEHGNFPIKTFLANKRHRNKRKSSTIWFCCVIVAVWFRGIGTWLPLSWCSFYHVLVCVCVQIVWKFVTVAPAITSVDENHIVTE